ncbi:uncharacterized protein M421DRAFT_156568 [Didymella exigua CBS 183.55]|uniref:Uncharacterized protein n=1 Tax=Didymella exigua CBS 183.55 TaxID=1150837 RepID=A0A6A5RMI9_9PLEO|nr:uncharacterized protein M421DRAFT_156568 [Didymella exigua CBS 183.55]KAF1928214.1 hypothetical protein M421DRAFT_156568 [Didymella exigua CBS 183.55]
MVKSCLAGRVRVVTLGAGLAYTPASDQVVHHTVRPIAPARIFWQLRTVLPRLFLCVVVQQERTVKRFSINDLG